MRRIERTNAFLRDFKREKRGHHRRELEMVLTVTVSLLAEDKPLPERNRDHTLKRPSGVSPEARFAADLSQTGY
jgi:mRNA interferase YafQ